MNSRDTHQIDPAALARLMTVGDAHDEMWTTEDLASMFQHQLSLPLADALGAGVSAPATVEGSGHSRLNRSFGEVLTDLHPDPALLSEIKSWAKEEWQNEDSDLPRALPIAFYFLSIAVALSRCGQRITSLSAARLKKSFNTVLGAPWLDAPSRALIAEGLETLEGLEGD